MKFIRSVPQEHAAVALVVVACVFACSKKDNEAAWQAVLDASVEDDDKDTKTRDKGDAGNGKPSTSTGKSDTSSTQQSEVTTVASTSSTSRAEASSAANSASSDDEPDATQTSSAAPTSVESDAGVNTSDEPATSDDDCAGYLVCESFEDVDVGDIPEGWTLRGEGLAVASGGAHRGERSLQITASDPRPAQMVRDASLLGEAHWGRVFYRVDLPVPEAFVHSTIVALSGDAADGDPAEFRLVNMNKQSAATQDIGSKANWAYNVQITGGQEWVCESRYDWEYDADWHCAEYRVDASTQTYEFYIDGERVNLTAGEVDGEGNCERTELPSQFDELRVGWNYYAAASPGFVVHLDDVAFDDERIGCD